MSVLGDARQALAEVVQLENVPAFPYLPGNTPKPAFLITPGSPYLESGVEGVPFGFFRVTFAVTYVSDTKANKNVTTDSDLMVEHLVTVLAIEGYEVGDVSAPFALSLNQVDYAAVQVSASTIITF